MEHTQELEYVEGKKPSLYKRVLLVLLVTAVLLGSAAYTAGYILFKGPSVYAGHQIIKAVQEHSVLRVLPRMYLSEAEIEAVLSEDGTAMFSVFPVAE